MSTPAHMFETENIELHVQIARKWEPSIAIQSCTTQCVIEHSKFETTAANSVGSTGKAPWLTQITYRR
jgi:hypothetical protein